MRELELLVCGTFISFNAIYLTWSLLLLNIFFPCLSIEWHTYSLNNIFTLNIITQFILIVLSFKNYLPYGMIHRNWKLPLVTLRIKSMNGNTKKAVSLIPPGSFFLSSEENWPNISGIHWEVCRWCIQDVMPCNYASCAFLLTFTAFSWFGWSHCSLNVWLLRLL